MRHHLVVLYDVVDDRRRATLRGGLRPIADRVQQSGWIVPPRVGFDAARMLRTLGPQLERSDRLRVYEPCPSCWAQARWFPRQPGPYDRLVVVE